MLLDVQAVVDRQSVDVDQRHDVVEEYVVVATAVDDLVMGRVDDGKTVVIVVIAVIDETAVITVIVEKVEIAENVETAGTACES